MGRFLKGGEGKLVLPPDCMVTDLLDFDAHRVGSIDFVGMEDISAGSKAIDIGPQSVDMFKDILKDAKTVLWNGPMGVFEIDEAAKGTYAVATMLADATDKGAVSIIGGGDSAAAVEKAGVADKMTHVSTGGGASLEFLEGKVLPGVAALTDK